MLVLLLLALHTMRRSQIALRKTKVKVKVNIFTILNANGLMLMEQVKIYKSFPLQYFVIFTLSYMGQKLNKQVTRGMPGVLQIFMTDYSRHKGRDCRVNQTE